MTPCLGCRFSRVGRDAAVWPFLMTASALGGFGRLLHFGHPPGGALARERTKTARERRQRPEDAPFSAPHLHQHCPPHRSRGSLTEPLRCSPDREDSEGAACKVRGMSHDSKRKRWTACGVCTACLATDCGPSPARRARPFSPALKRRTSLKRPQTLVCRVLTVCVFVSRGAIRGCAWAGDCINCLDKSKFGGQGAPPLRLTRLFTLQLSPQAVPPFSSSRPHARVPGDRVPVFSRHRVYPPAQASASSRASCAAASA